MPLPWYTDTKSLSENRFALSLSKLVLGAVEAMSLRRFSDSGEEVVIVELSETALSVLHDAVRESGLEGGRAVRLVRDGDQYALTIDVPSGWDKIIEYDHVPVLVLSRDVEDSLGPAVIEVKEDSGAYQFIVYRTSAEAKGRP